LIILTRDYTTFDIITDLTFGEPLYCLRDNKYHNWVNIVYASLKAMGLSAVYNRYLIFNYYDKVRSLFQDTTAHVRSRIEFYKLVHDKVERRLVKIDEEGNGEGKADFFSHIIKNQGSEAKKLTREEMDSNAIVLLAAGSETTATTLSGTTYLLLSNPDVYTKLVHEIRSKFNSQADITIEEVNKLDYLIACFQEGLRHYPPGPTGFPRVVPAGGNHISGLYIPEGTSVYVSQHAANHSSRNFKDPEAYVPERWLGDERYKDDNRECWNPFSFGPRNCLGKKYVYIHFSLY
jgi:cytochrome P450